MENAPHLNRSTDHGQELFELALDMAQPDPVTSAHDTVSQLLLSIELDRIARALFRTFWIVCGRPETPDWSLLPLALQQRYRYLAERAMATIDPQVRLDAQEQACVDTEDWMNGPYDGNPPTYHAMAHFAVSQYESLLAGVRIDRERGL